MTCRAACRAMFSRTTGVAPLNCLLVALVGDRNNEYPEPHQHCEIRGQIFIGYIAELTKHGKTLLFFAVKLTFDLLAWQIYMVEGWGSYD